MFYHDQVLRRLFDFVLVLIYNTIMCIKNHKILDNHPREALAISYNKLRIIVFTCVLKKENIIQPSVACHIYERLFPPKTFID